MTDDYEFLGSAVIFCFKGRELGEVITVYCNEAGYLVTNETFGIDKEYATHAEMQVSLPEIAEKIGRRMNGEAIT